MKVSHIEHLGIAVKSLEEAIPYWENVLGLKCYAIEEVADQKVKTAFLLAYYQYDVALANLLSICGIPEAFHQYRMDGKTEIL